MIESKTRKIMLGGMQKFANEQNIPTEDAQINISFKPDTNDLVYKMCHGWQPYKKVDFKYILNKKLDLLGLEAMSVPVLKQSLLYYMEKHDIEKEDISVFLFNRNEKVGLAVFDGSESVYNISLANHLAQIGY